MSHHGDKAKSQNFVLDPFLYVEIESILYIKHLNSRHTVSLTKYTYVGLFRENVLLIGFTFLFKKISFKILQSSDHYNICLNILTSVCNNAWAVPIITLEHYNTCIITWAMTGRWEGLYVPATENRNKKTIFKIGDFTKWAYFDKQ